MNKSIIALAFMVYILCGCSKNTALHEHYVNNIIKVGENKNNIETKLGKPLKFEENEDGTITTVYSLKDQKIYKTIIILYNNNLNVSHYILQ